MLEAQIVDLPQVSLMARLILSARSLPMDAINQRDLDVIHADQCIEAFKESVHDLAKCFENLTMRGVLIDDFQFIEGPKESLLGLVGKAAIGKRAADRQGRAVRQIRRGISGRGR
jgi:hypothetical protein